MNARIRSRLKGAAKRARLRLLRLGGGTGARAYYRFAGRAFDGELAAVGAGLAEYSLQHPDSGLGYHMRRNVHMLEKGLTMRPLRTTFAADYIGTTVDGVVRYVGAGDGTDDEKQWMSDVLVEYFKATAESVDPRIVAARQSYPGRLHEGAGVEHPTTTLVPAPPQTADDVVRIDDLIRLAGARRSVRWYLPQRVDRAIVRRALEVGLEAPSACNRQPFRFILLDEPTKIAEVAAIPMGTKGYRHQLVGLVVVVGDLSAFFSERDRHLIYVDGCLAAMSFVLGLEAQGVATCCINWPDMPDREAAIRDSLSLAGHERVIMLISYGYADPEGLAPRSARRRVEDIARFWSPDDPEHSEPEGLEPTRRRVGDRVDATTTPTGAVS